MDNQWLTTSDGSPYIVNSEEPRNPVWASQSPSALAQSKEPFTDFDYHSVDDWTNELYRLYKNGDVSAGEKLFNYYATKDSEKTARDWTASREDTAYQRLIADLKEAGISPYVLSGATPAVSNSTGATYSGSQMTSAQSSRNTINKETLNDATSIITRVLMVLGIIAAAAL